MVFLRPGVQPKWRFCRREFEVEFSSISLSVISKCLLLQCMAEFLTCCFLFGGILDEINYIYTNSRLTICFTDSVFYSSHSLFRTGPVCSDGWVVHGDSCFLVIDIPALEWNDARRNCKKLGGDLAKITSAAENQFISDLLTKQKKAGNAWLGLYRKADKKFYWVDGTQLTGYTAWDKTEPNNANNGDEDCVLMYGRAGSAKGTWNDLPCTRPNSAAQIAPVVLCKKNFN